MSDVLDFFVQLSRFIQRFQVKLLQFTLLAYVRFFWKKIPRYFYKQIFLKKMQENG